MTFLSRKEALAAGSPIYNTGKPCKHGHFADRYTQSGTCKTCVASLATNGASPVAAPPPVPENDDPLRNERIRQQSEANLQAVTTKFRVKLVDLALIKNVVDATNLMRWPLVDPQVFCLRHKAPTGSTGDTAMFFYKLHPDDIDSTRQAVNAIFFGTRKKPELIEHEKRMAAAGGMSLDDYRKHADILDRGFRE